MEKIKFKDEIKKEFEQKRCPACGSKIYKFKQRRRHESIRTKMYCVKGHRFYD